MQHKGEILKKAIAESGISVKSIAEKLNRSRRSLYDVFHKYNVSIDLILAIGDIIRHDFSDDIKELKKYKIMHGQEGVNEVSKTIYENGPDYWKDKYLELLEKYNALLESAGADKKKRKSK